ncbi:MAG: MFS transporter [Candidatus Nanopelagicales bacterium]
MTGSPADASPGPRLRPARVAVAVAFAVQGVCFAALVTRIPTLQDRFDLSEGALAGLLALVPVVAGVGSVAAGALAPRRGSRALLRVLGPVVPLALVAAGFAGSLPLLVLALVVLGLGLGSVDATMNMQAVEVQAAYGRPVMASFYAVFSLANIVGAGLAAGAAATSWSLGAFFLGLALVAVPVQLAVGHTLLTGRHEAAAAETAQTGRPDVAVPWRPILALGLVLACVYVLDSSASNWSAVYLTDVLDSPESVAALAYGSYALAVLVARTAVDRVVIRTGPVRLVRLGGLVAVGAVVAVALAPSAPVALAAFALLGVGVAPAIPLAFAAADAHDPSASGRAVARVNVFNYVGFVVGAPLVGLVAEGSSLRWGFAVLVPVALVLVLLARAYRPAAAPHPLPST